MTELTETDEGKTVVNAEGITVGMVSEVEGGLAYVDPDPGITDKVKSRLGWTNRDESDYTLEEGLIDEITDDEIRIGL